MPTFPLVTIPPDVFAPAVAHWWKSKTTNKGSIKKSQGGTRDSNLRGDTMDGFRDVIISHLKAAGISEDDIFAGSQLSRLASNLPSYFRATKNWDLIVVKSSHFKRLQGDLYSQAQGEPLLLAALEFKSQEDSIGNNQPNRIEESIGCAADFWASYENLLHPHAAASLVGLSVHRQICRGRCRGAGEDYAATLSDRPYFLRSRPHASHSHHDLTGSVLCGSLQDFPEANDPEENVRWGLLHHDPREHQR